MSTRKWSLSFLVAFWIGIAIAFILTVFIVVQYVTTPDVSLADLVLRNLARLIVFAAVIHVLAFVIIRALVLRPIERLHRHLYRVGTGAIEEIDLASHVAELQTLEDGVNLMVHRMKAGGLERAVEVEREQAAGVPEWVLAAGDRPAHLSMSLQQTLERKRGARVAEWWPAAMLVVPLVTVVALVYFLRPDPVSRGVVDEALQLQRQMNGKLDQVVAAARAQEERLRGLESAVQEGVRGLEAKLASSTQAASTPAAVADPPAPVTDPAFTKALAQLRARVGAVEAAAAVSVQEVDGLRTRLDNIAAAGNAGDPNLANRISELLARLAAAEAQVDDLMGLTETAVSDASRGFLDAIQQFMEYAESDFSLIRGTRVSNDRLGLRGTAHRSRDPFPGAVSTLIWDVGADRWCEAALHQASSRDEAMGEFERLEADVNHKLPAGWSMTPVRIRDYEAAQKIIAPGGRSFLVACYEVRKQNQDVWLTALQFGR